MNSNALANKSTFDSDRDSSLIRPSIPSGSDSDSSFAKDDLAGEHSLMPPASDNTWVDEEGAATLQAIDDRDTPDSQADLARRFMARTTTDLKRTTGLLKNLGGWHTADAIRRSG